MLSIESSDFIMDKDHFEAYLELYGMSESEQKKSKYYKLYSEIPEEWLKVLSDL